MTVESTRTNWILRLAVLVAILVAAYLGAVQLLRQTAVVARSVKGVAVKTVLGTVEVKAEYIQELRSEASGRVVASALDVGRHFARGDDVVRLDTGDIDLELERLRSEITAARRKVELGSTIRSEVENMRDTIANLEQQAKAGTYATAEVERQRRNLRQIEQRMELDEVASRLALENLETMLRAKERQKGKMTITSPLDGVVTAAYARPGDLINGGAPIAAIMATTNTVEGKLSEEDFAVVAVGQKASVRFLTYGGNQYNAVVTKILPAADPQTQRYGAFLDVALPEDKPLVPGLTGEVSITVAQRANAVLVPRRALVGDYVYVVAHGRVAVRQVEKGYASLNAVEILSGLEEGELVIVEQQDVFRSGDRVKTVEVVR